MAEHLKLRPYQEQRIKAVFDAWTSGMKRPAVVLPTGAGKTVVFSHLVEKFRDWRTACDGNPINGGNRVMILVHRDELADQAIDKLRQIAPTLYVGKVKAQDNETHADVMVCSVQTLANEKRRRQIYEDQEMYGDIGLIITDECHHAAAVSYWNVYDMFIDALNVGFTATLARGDGVGLGDVWDEVVYTKSVLNMIGNGFLVDVKAKKVDIAGLNFGDVKKSGGDYQVGSLAEALEETDAFDHIAEAYQEHAKDRQGVVFTPTVATAHAAMDSFMMMGIQTAVISGETLREERLKIFEDFRTGKVQVLSNCMVLTEGFDAPWASCAVIARPTQSQPLYVQMVGRVLRPWPGKKDALVLDVTGAGGLELKTLVDLEPGAVSSLKDGETLEQAIDRENEEFKEQQREDGRRGFFRKTDSKLKFLDHDLFAASEVNWLRTERGVLFISTDAGEVFLWPTKGVDGYWDVCFAPKKGAWERRHECMPLEMAMAWGEADAEDFASFSVRNSSSWRKGKPSEAQVILADRMGIENPEAMRKGDLADALSVKYASRKFDRHVK